jgi:hypothetical protein
LHGKPYAVKSNVVHGIVQRITCLVSSGILRPFCCVVQARNGSCSIARLGFQTAAKEETGDKAQQLELQVQLLSYLCYLAVFVPVNV